MAGFWNQSYQQLHDLNGRPLIGARAFFFAASTTAPITVYQDYSLAVAHPNPVVANGRGIFPAVFLDEEDEFFRVRITDANGVLIEGTDTPVLPIIGPTGGGGGSETPVDANALLKTGDFFWQPQSGSRSGFVRANARTIGSSTSGAAERANADCEQLFLHLWATYSDTLCPVNGGRGVSAAADWAANKYIGTPDARGLSPIGLADMGNTDSTRLDGVTFAVGDKTTAMSRVGAATQTLVAANLPPYTPTGTVATTINGNPNGLAYYGGANVLGQGGVGGVVAAGSTSLSATSSFVGAAQGGTSTPVDKMQPSMTGTWYIKL